MRVFLLSSVLSLAAACGGKVVFESPSSTSTSTGGAGGAACADTCAETLTHGGAECAGATNNAYEVIFGCACDHTCPDACGDSYCALAPASAACDACLQEHCVLEHSFCTSN